MQIICDRYRDYAKKKPQIIEAQELNCKALQDRISQTKLISVPGTRLDRPRDDCVVSHLASTGRPAVSAVIERMNRYIKPGKLDLARKIVKKELGHLPECSEILQTLSRIDSCPPVGSPSTIGRYL
jgi:hypothetical protein